MISYWKEQQMVIGIENKKMYIYIDIVIIISFLDSR